MLFPMTTKTNALAIRQLSKEVESLTDLCVKQLAKIKRLQTEVRRLTARLDRVKVV